MAMNSTEEMEIQDESMGVNASANESANEANESANESANEANGPNGHHSAQTADSSDESSDSNDSNDSKDQHDCDHIRKMQSDDSDLNWPHPHMSQLLHPEYRHFGMNFADRKKSFFAPMIMIAEHYDAYRQRLDDILSYAWRQHCARFEKGLLIYSTKFGSHHGLKLFIDRALHWLIRCQYQQLLRGIDNHMSNVKRARFETPNNYEQYSVLRLMDAYTLFKLNSHRDFDDAMTDMKFTICWHGPSLKELVDPLIALQCLRLRDFQTLMENELHL